MTSSNLTSIGIVVVVGAAAAFLLSKNHYNWQKRRSHRRKSHDEHNRLGVQSHHEEDEIMRNGVVANDDIEEQPLDDPLRYLQEDDKWKMLDTSTEQFIRQLPKVELHVHLDGSFDTDILWNYYLKNKSDMLSWCLPVNTILPWDQSVFPVRKLVEQCRTADDFRKLCTCRGRRSLYEMIKCFEVFLPVVRAHGNLDLLEDLAYDFCRRQAQQRIVYTEVRYSPHLLAEGAQLNNNNSANTADDPNTDKDASPTYLLDRAEQVLQVITKGLQRGCIDFGITVHQILCAITWRPDWAMHVVELADKYRPPLVEDCNDTTLSGCAYVVGVDIAAGEEHFDPILHPDLFQPHYDMMQRAKELKIPITLHAGEVGQAENVTTAVHDYGAMRIGHGYRMLPETRRMLKEQNIHVEVCPTSSAETGGWDYGTTTTNQQPRKWHEHPVVDMLRDGLSVSINSDNPAVFDTSLCWQYRILLGKAGVAVSKEDAIAMTRHAIDAAFCSNVEKNRLRHVLRVFLENQCQQQGNPSSNRSIDYLSRTQQQVLHKTSFHDRVRSHHSF